MLFFYSSALDVLYIVSIDRLEAYFDFSKFWLDLYEHREGVGEHGVEHGSGHSSSLGDQQVRSHDKNPELQGIRCKNIS